MTHPAANVVGQQLGWFACVVGAAQGYPFLGATAALIVVAFHLRALADPVRELKLLALAAGLGIVVESGLQAGGTIRYAGSWDAVPWLCPPWIAVLWLQFGTTIRIGFRWLRGRPWLAAAVGMIGGPLAFRAGEALGAVRFAPDRRLTYLALAAVWGICLPILTVAAGRLAPAGPAIIGGEAVERTR